jgi:hypothetical protein
MEDSYVGKSIRVRYGGGWMEGFIDEYHPDRGYHVQYFDGDDAWIPSVNDANVQVEMEDNVAEQKDNGDLDDIDFFDRQEELGDVDVPGLSEPEEQNMNEDEDEEELHIIPSNSVPKKSNSRPSSSHHSLADPGLQDDLDLNMNLEEDEGIPLDDDILMGEDLDEDIMLKTADEYDDMHPTQNNDNDKNNLHVVVHTYEGNEEEGEELDHPSLASGRKSSSSRSEEKMLTPRQQQEEEEEDEVREESPEDEVPVYHNLEYYQEKIHDIISSQSVYLQNNNILLVGSVLSASFHDNNTTNDNDKEAKKSAKETSYDYKQVEGGRASATSASSSSLLKKSGSKSNKELLKKQEMFFRVLFIEGGNQPIMFRCKTPIFTSHNAIVLKHQVDEDLLPKWKENIFRCDLIMPVIPSYPSSSSNDAALLNKKSSTGSLTGRGGKQQQSSQQGRLLATVAESKNERDSREADNEDNDDDLENHHTASFPISGEIMISVYRSRGENGGNDLIGQISFDLKKMSKTGTYEYYNELCEGRCYQGKYPLTSTSSLTNKKEIIGEIELLLSIAWKIPSLTDQYDQQQRRIPSSSSQSIARPKSASAAAIAANASSSSLKKGAEAKGIAITTKKPSTTAATKTKKNDSSKNFISANLGKQREEQRRIDIANKKLLHSIQKLSGKTSGAAYVKQPNDGKQPSSSVAPNKTAVMVNNFMNEEKATCSVSGGGGGGGGGGSGKGNNTQEQKLYEKYLHTYLLLKKSISEEDENIKFLKGKVSNYNLQIKKYQLNIEKIKSYSNTGGGGSGSSVTSSGSNLSRTSGKGRSAQGMMMASSTPIRKQLPSSSASIDYSSQQKISSSSFAVGNQSSKQTNRIGGAKGEDEGREDNTTVMDAEYQSIKEEYDMLQKLRKSLLQRIRNAKEIYQSYYQTINISKNQQKKIDARILAIRGTGTMISDDGRENEDGITTIAAPFDENHSQFEAITSARRNGKHGKSRRDEESKQQQNQEEEEEDDDDVEIFQQVIALLSEKQCYSELINENLEFYNFQSNYEENKAILLIMQEKLSSLNKEISELKQQKEVITGMKLSLDDNSSSRPSTSQGNPSRTPGKPEEKTSSSSSLSSGLVITNIDDDQEVLEKREQIYYLKTLQYSSQKENQLNLLLNQMKENEIQLMYLQMKQKERKDRMIQEGGSGSGLGNSSSVSSILQLSPSRTSEDLLLNYSRSQQSIELANSVSKGKLSDRKIEERKRE